MSVHQASLLTRIAVSAFGRARLPTVAALLFLMMMKEVNSSAQHLVPLAHSPSMPTQLTADSISSASMESPESRVVLSEKCSMLDRDLVRTDSAQTQNLCLNVQTTMLAVIMWS